MFKEHAFLDMIRASYYKVLESNSNFSKTPTASLREIVYDIKKSIFNMNYKTVIEKYGNVLKEEYKKLIQNTFRLANVIISNTIKRENNKNGEVSEDIDEEDYDTMHHDIYDEAERLKKIAERSTYGDVKIIDDTIEFTTE